MNVHKNLLKLPFPGGCFLGRPAKFLVKMF